MDIANFALLDPLTEITRIASESFPELLLTFQNGKSISGISMDADEIIKRIRKNYYRFAETAGGFV